jgi:YD repeat-containing protein
MIDPTGLTSCTDDARNRLTSIANNKGRVTSLTHDVLGRRTSVTQANGVVTSYSCDTADQLLCLAPQLGATTINSYIYTYDKVGDRKPKAD